MVALYDKLGINEDIELDLSMLEATGLITHDESKNHIMGTFHNGITWQAVDAGHYGVRMHELQSRYLDAPAADTAALNFTSTDYSLVIWIDAGHYEDDDMVIMGRYRVYDPDVPMIMGEGWELYYYDPTNLITLRHHHGTTRTGAYSGGWTYDGNLRLFGVSRRGATAQHYMNGQPIATIISAGGLIDPSTNTTYDLTIGCRYTKDTHFWTGQWHRPRAWSRALSDAEHLAIFEHERGWFA